MKYILGIACLVWGYGIAPVQAQPVGADAAPLVRLYGGLTYHSLTDASTFWRDLLTVYQQAGVPVPEQRTYPVTYLAGADMLFPLSSAEVGVGVRWSRAWATSLYGDYAGVLDLHSKAHMLTLEGVSRFLWSTSRKWQPYVGTRGGPLLGLYRIEEHISLAELGTSTSEIKGWGIGFSIEGFGGVTYRSSPLLVHIQGGYRYAVTNEVRGRTWQDGERGSKGTLPFRLGFAGPVVTVGFDIPLN